MSDTRVFDLKNLRQMCEKVSRMSLNMEDQVKKYLWSFLNHRGHFGGAHVKKICRCFRHVLSCKC